MGEEDKTEARRLQGPAGAAAAVVEAASPGAFLREFRCPRCRLLLAKGAEDGAIQVRHGSTEALTYAFAGRIVCRKCGNVFLIRNEADVQEIEAVT